ncbi:hypothetical protein [Nocardioides mangrovi]|uniref:Uncharacterized protein n=1 Tax=Nocardioides mangrovi TaxID=2874580 RepID=A0ABS7UJX4_9ACTN|nr:hypothetical protein [Nocardioides mangrovi]MBZ5741339.1 hypothetical protein [Nocardioides mangrovi]
MTTSVDTQDWVAGWLEDFRACLAGTHGHAWRASAERELRTHSTALVSDRQRATSWRRTREAILGSSDAA